MTTAAPKPNKMGIQPVNRLLITMSLPIMLSMLVQALYNIVDSVFVARVSQDALTAVTLAFPVQNLMIAIATGTGVGINAVLSRSLGAQELPAANRTAHNAILLAVFSSLLFVVFGAFFPALYFRAQSDNPAVIAYGTDYLRICTVCSIGLFGQITLERLLQATGKTIYTMFIQGSGALINIALDYCLIFGKFGLPRLGVPGAAVATVIGQCCACALAVVFNLRCNHELTFSLRALRPDLPTIGQIYAVGLPSILLASLASVMTLGMNNLLRGFSSAAVNVFGIYFKLQSFIFMPVFGLNNGMVPIVAYNYGAGNGERILKAVKLGVIYAVSIMFVGFLLFQWQPARMLALFDATPEMISIGVTALRIISVSFLCAGFCIISISTMQALGHGVISLMISATRQLLFLLPLAFLFSRTEKLHLVWLAFPAAELAAVTLCALFLRHIYTTQIAVLKPAVASGTPQPEEESPAEVLL